MAMSLVLRLDLLDDLSVRNKFVLAGFATFKAKPNIQHLKWRGAFIPLFAVIARLTH
jgi:hypothetical protein